MRRTQVDTREAPVRNLALNPSLRTAAGSAIMRTNLITYPNFETTGSTTTIRTNLTSNPRGVWAFGGYSGEANQTITPNVAITDHPLGITTANRVEYTTGSNPGVHFINPAIAGTTYTVSAWIYHEVAPSSGSAAFAQAGVISQPSPPAIVQGVWRRQSWTYTATATSQIGFRVSSQGSPGSFLITGVLVELTSGLQPYFDAATPLTNLCTNPSFTTNVLGYTGMGANPTRVTNQGGDGAVCELSQLAAGATRLGAIYIHNSRLDAGEYSVSFDYKATDASLTHVRSFLYDTVTATVVSDSISIPLNKDGSFHRYRYNFTASASYDRVYMELLGTGIPLGTKAWIDRAVVERGTTNGEYYEGTGDYTYAWSGTAEASTSLQQSQSINGWAHLGVTHTSPSNPYSGLKSGAVKTLGRNGDGIWPADVTILPNTTYTFSAMIKTTTVHGLTAGFRWKDSAGASLGLPDSNVTLTSQLVTGDWVRISATATSPALAGRLQLMVRIYETHAPTIFYLDEAMITDSMTAVPYFDGGTPDAGDYVYDWTGAGHISSSVMKYTTVPGSVAARNSSGYPDSKFFCIHSTAENGKKTAKWISAPLQGSAGWRVGGLNTAGFNYSDIKAGKTYTLFMRFRTSGWSTAQGFGVKISYGSGINNVCDFTASNLWPLLNQTGWQTYTRTFTALRDADAGQMLYIALPAIHNASTEGIFEMSEWAIYEGEYTGDFIDGATPFSNWQGTANASTSIGYEPSLRDIGFPDTELVGLGDTGNIDVDPYAARTIYVVYESTDMNYAWQAPLYYAKPTVSSVTTGLAFQTSSIGDLYMYPRGDFGNGTQNGTFGFRSRLVGRHVISMAFSQGLTSVAGEGDNGTTVTRTFVPGDGWGSGRLYSFERFGISHVHTFVYYAEHDLATRKRISQFLGNKYGANV